MDMVDFICADPDLAYINKMDQYGGKRFELKFSPELKEMMTWYKNHKIQLEREQRAREQFQSVASAYEQYQTTLKLVLDQI